MGVISDAFAATLRWVRDDPNPARSPDPAATRPAQATPQNVRTPSVRAPLGLQPNLDRESPIVQRAGRPELRTGYGPSDRAAGTAGAPGNATPIVSDSRTASAAPDRPQSVGVSGSMLPTPGPKD